MRRLDNAHFQEIRARTPQTASVLTSIPASTTSAGPFFPDPSTYSTPSTVPNASGSNARAVKSIIEYLFLIIALLLASIILFRRVIRHKRRQRAIYDNDLYPSLVHLRPRSFPRTTGLPPPDANAPYPLLRDPLAALPAAYLGQYDRRVHGHDIDIDGRRLGAAATELDHDGPLSDKDMLPAYDYSGGPPKYAELELQRSFATENTTPTTPQNPTPTIVPLFSASLEDPNQTASQDVVSQLSVSTNPEPRTSHSNLP